MVTFEFAFVCVCYFCWRVIIISVCVRVRTVDVDNLLALSEQSSVVCCFEAVTFIHSRLSKGWLFNIV